MSAKEFVNSLGINNDGYMKDSSYVVTILDSDEYSRIYTKLDNAEELDMNPDTFKMDEHLTSIDYLGDEYKVNLRADFDDNEYHVIVTPIEK